MLLDYSKAVAAVGGMAILIIASAYNQPRIVNAVRSVWSRINGPRVHNETTSTDGPQTVAQQRTLFTTSQQNLDSKSATSNKLDRRVMSQVDQILASITGYQSVQDAQSSPPPEIQSQPAPEVLGPPTVLWNPTSYVPHAAASIPAMANSALAAVPSENPRPYVPHAAASIPALVSSENPTSYVPHESALIPALKNSALAIAPSAPVTSFVASQHSLRTEPKNVNNPCLASQHSLRTEPNHVNHLCLASQLSLRTGSNNVNLPCMASQHSLSRGSKTRPVRSSTSVDLSTTRQPEVTSLFNGNPCAPPITTFAPSSHGFTFSLTNPPTKRDPDLYAHSVDVNELVAALAANPNLKSPPKCVDPPKNVGPIESAHGIENDRKTGAAMSPVLPAEKHVSICLSEDKVNRLSSSVLGANSISKKDPFENANDKMTYCFSSRSPQTDLDSLLSSENKKMFSSTTFTSAETDLSFESVRVDYQQQIQQPIHETSACRLQAPVPPVTNKDLASKSATSQRSNIRIERKNTF